MHASEERAGGPAPAADVLSGGVAVHLKALARAVAPATPSLGQRFAKALAALGYDAPRRNALLEIAPSSAIALLAARRPASRFLEEVEENGRRLARLNVPPPAAVDALRMAERMLDEAAGGRFQPAREQLHLATVLALNNAYYDVRETETQAFFGLARAETAARDLPDLLRRFAGVLARAFGARGAALALDPDCAAPAAARPRYLADARGFRDARLRRLGRCGWSFPIPGAAGRIELVFARPHRWLPREAELLRAAAERCGLAIERERLIEQVATLAAAARRAEEEERHRLGRELHDDTAQALLALRLRLEMLERDVPGAVAARVAELRESVERSLGDLRRVIAALSPATLDRLGLEAALRHLAARFRRRGGPEIRTRISRGLGGAPADAAEAVYRVAQESLENILRHSQASHVNLSVRLADGKVRLSVTDDGAGFDAEAARSRAMSFGLAGMRERAERSGGTFRLRSAPGKGTAVSLEVPLRPPGTERHGKNSSSSHR